MKKHLSFFPLVLIVLALLTGCTSESVITSYYLNQDGYLIAVDNSGNETNLGDWDESLIQSLGTVTISTDGYYTINGIETDIVARVPESYYLDEDGHLILVYSDLTEEDLGPLGSTLVNGISTIEISEDGYYVINGIETEISAINVYTVSFTTGFSTTITSQKVKDGYKVERPELTRTGYTFLGWFCEGEPWNFNSDVVKNDMTLVAEWSANQYSISFFNEKGGSPSSMIVTFGSGVSLPNPPEAPGYSFTGWYYGNNKVESGLWGIASNTTLVARWTTNSFVITLNPGSGSVSQTTVTVGFGESYTLPIPTNSFGTFSGWLCNGEAVTDSNGRSLNNWNFTSDQTFTVNWIIQIFTANDLAKLNNFLNGNFVLMNDIDLQGVNWTPVGTYANPFIGRLDGDGYKIRNLSLTVPVGYTGLFGYLKGSITSLTLENVSFNIGTATQDSYVGALCGFAQEATINEVIVNGSVNTAGHSSQYQGFTGGFIGYALQTTIAHSVNNATVSGAFYVGGFMAKERACTISYCVNNGTITSSQSNAGGIMAYFDAVDTSLKNFSRLKNTGAISAYMYAGGIIGAVPSGSYISLSECINYGTIRGGTDTNFGAGGLIGESWAIIANNCYNRGNITRGYATGGLFGRTVYGGAYSNCYSSGNISSTFYSGGLSGYGGMHNSITETVIFGSISSGTASCSTMASTIVYEAELLANVYYNCSAGTYRGIQTSERYSSTFYKNSLFWTEYNEQTHTGNWVFSTTNYPILSWE